MWDEAGRLTDWLGDIPVEAQLLKLSEEVGEVAEAYLGMTGLNPRKGVSHTRDDLTGEVADVIITAAVAIVRLTGSPQAARAAFEAHLAGVLARVGLDPAPIPVREGLIPAGEVPGTAGEVPVSAGAPVPAADAPEPGTPSAGTPVGREEPVAGDPVMIGEQS